MSRSFRRFFLASISVFFPTLIIVILLIFGVTLVLYYTWRVRRIKQVLLSKEIREAHESIRDGLSEIRSDLLGELRLLESSGKALSGDELTRKDHLLRELEKIEKNMERELSDIEEKI